MSGRTKQFLTLRDMTRGSGCTPRTVRYYEREGLLHAERSAGGHRKFPPGELERLIFILSLREAGWSLDEITALFHVRDRAPGDREACSRLGSLLHQQITRLRDKISVLERLHDDLVRTAGLLSICTECTDRCQPECGKCERVPQLADQPHSFRLSWRAAEVRAAAALQVLDPHGGDQ